MSSCLPSLFNCFSTNPITSKNRRKSQQKISISVTHIQFRNQVELGGVTATQSGRNNDDSMDFEFEDLYYQPTIVNNDRKRRPSVAESFSGSTVSNFEDTDQQFEMSYHVIYRQSSVVGGMIVGALEPVDLAAELGIRYEDDD